MSAEILSALASILIFASTFPQVRQTWHTKLTRDLSFLNLIFCVTGLAVSTAYAAITFQWIFVIGDGVDMAMWSSVLVMKLRNIKNKQDVISWKEEMYRIKGYGIVLCIVVKEIVTKKR